MASFTVRAGLIKAVSLDVCSELLLVGKRKHLTSIVFNEELATKFGKHVSEALWKDAVSNLPKQGVVPLYLNRAKIISVPDEVSRHNAQSSSLAIFDELQSVKYCEETKKVSIVLFADFLHVLSSVAAIARCFPLYDKRTSHKSSLEKVDLEVVVKDEKSLTAADVEFLQSLSDSVRQACRLIDMPCNELHSEALVEEAMKFVGKLDGVKTTVIKGEELKEKGFGGIYNVGKAAAHPPVFLCFSYQPSDATECYALVGKGIVFDAGGMQIKTKTTMPNMKRDMGGAAGLLSAFYALVKSGFRQSLHCLLCIAENSVSPQANRPDDIITMLSGKTVEITNTDAEGRLVLADGVFYARSVLKANVIIDMATLTGAQAYATGKFHAAVLTNSEEWEKKACEAGRISGDLVHPLPFCPDLHFCDLKSPVADMRNANLGKMKGPPSSIAGLFISSHIELEKDVNWLHFDIAFPVENIAADRATGYGPALISVLLAKDTKVPLLSAVA